MTNQTKHELLDVLVKAEREDALPELLAVMAEFCGPRRVTEMFAKVIDAKRAEQARLDYLFCG